MRRGARLAPDPKTAQGPLLKRITAISSADVHDASQNTKKAMHSRVKI